MKNGKEKKRIAAGILAHVDSGKTTLSEALLYRTGMIKKPGRVDHRDAFLDTENIERDRGITVFSKQAVMTMGDTCITLLDTPGHADFSAEMERTLQVMDYAVLVISGTDGVQSHTKTLWKLLARQEIPVFIFVNKMDLTDRDAKHLLEMLKKDLSPGCVDFSGEKDSEALCENIAETSEEALDYFLKNGRTTDRQAAEAVRARKIFPCYFGSALKLKGIDELIDGFTRYMTAPAAKNGFGARVFKISRDDRGNRLTHMKITGGALQARDILEGSDKHGHSWSEKVNEIRIYSGVGYSTSMQAGQGIICAVTGLNSTYPGEGIGSETGGEEDLLEPFLTYKVDLAPEQDPHVILDQLKVLEEEEPKLYVSWNEELQEIHLQLMGEIQLEIIRSLMKERFNEDIRFDRGDIMYRETIAGRAEGVGHFEPLRHYAEVHLIMEPGPEGSGLVFDSSCSEDVLDRNWQRLIMTHLEEKQHRGILTGSPLTDTRITLSAGRAHNKHTEGGDFRQATYRAVRQGLMEAGCILLEPWYSFEMEMPDECVGHAIADIQRMGGSFSAPHMENGSAAIKGKAPAVEMRSYPAEFSSFTGGAGRLSFLPAGYRPCHDADKVIAEKAYDCESDVADTADSVFCEKGSSFLVKWDKVKEHMHLESTVAVRPAGGENGERSTGSAAISDAELMGDFDRLYGTRRNTRERQAIPARVIDEKTLKGGDGQTGSPGANYVAEESAGGPEYILVDGYNLIFAWEELSKLAAADFGSARDKLIEVLCNYQGFRGCELILVFDAYKVKGGRGSVERIGDIDVVYTKEAETADMYIEKVTHRMRDKKRARVITSDGMEQLIILGHGSVRTSSRSFIEEIKQTEAEMKRILNGR